MAKTSVKLTLQPACLRWARERAKQSLPELAKKLGVKEEKVVAWEQSGEISMALAEKLANSTRTPLGYLFLPEPLTEELPISDFRTVNTQDISSPTADLLEVVDDALLRQDWYREYILSNNGDSLPFVGSLKASSDIVEAAKSIRDVVGWGAKLREQSSSSEDVLSRHIDAVEQAGILVMRSSIVGNNTSRHLSVSEFRGFALSNEYAPLIFINGQDAKVAQMFTLAHELVHIWLGVSGVTNLNQTYPSEISNERFCNGVAAELLVPLEELRTIWPMTETSSNRFAQTARYFRVSSLVILRRLRDAGELSKEEFERRYTDELVQFKLKTSTVGGGDFYRALYARLGKRFVSALVESTLEGGTSYRDAFQLLGVNKAETVRELASRMRVSA